MAFTILKALVNQVGVIVLLAVLLSRINIFRNFIAGRNFSWKNVAAMVFFFSLFGITGTYLGVPVKGALANSRVVGVFVGGLIGGPVVGILSGLLAGVHRWAIDIGGFTAFPCMIATICEGVLAGFLSQRFLQSKRKWLFALYGGVAAEMLQMAILLLLVRPFNEAVDLVSIIGFPMITANAIGISMFVAIVEYIMKEQERIAASQSRTVLAVTRKTINLFRRGLSPVTTSEAADIILRMTDVSAVAFTNREKILAHSGDASNHHKPGSLLMTRLTKRVLEDGKTRTASTPEDISCSDKNCPLKCAVIVPLKQQKKVIGTLKMYKSEKNAITPVDIELAEGLASLFSTQLELSRMDEQEKLLKQAELGALQSQINPHFLFNALNTIVSLVRTNPERGRELLIKLSSYFRKSLSHKSEITLAEEIETVKNYLEIEKARFGDKLTIAYDIDPRINCTLPPFTLQPIVENALKHGLLSRIEGGHVTISAKKHKGNVHIEVEDNGSGIKKETLATILESNDKQKGIGIVNVHKRLQYTFGPQYGLTFESEPEHGTKVRITLPGDAA